MTKRKMKKKLRQMIGYIREVDEIIGFQSDLSVREEVQKNYKRILGK